MHLLAQEEYGLRCLVQLARHRDSTPLTIPEIAAAEGLSPEYTAKLMRALRQGGLVMSTRGAAGGYRLARRAEEVTGIPAANEPSDRTTRPRTDTPSARDVVTGETLMMTGLPRTSLTPSSTTITRGRIALTPCRMLSMATRPFG